jgi:diguanylate cyclase (GGDEF)-like protein
LCNWGYQITAVADGNEAWKVLQGESAPELVILDWMMSGIDGPELCRRIRDRQRTAYQYVLLVTVKDNTQDVITGLEAGADDYLTKPFDTGELRARLWVGKRILRLQYDLLQAQEGLRFRATHDALTGIWNRAAVLDLLRGVLQRGARTGNPTGVLIVDLDHFKNINDTFGHLCGDVVLRNVAHRISQAVRSYDFVGRYGGEEFLVVLSDCQPGDLLNAAERVRAAVENEPLLTETGELHVTASVGAVASPLGASAQQQLLKLADSALYRAKSNGRNRTEIAEAPASMSAVRTAAATGKP